MKKILNIFFIVATLGLWAEPTESLFWEEESCVQPAATAQDFAYFSTSLHGIRVESKQSIPGLAPFTPPNIAMVHDESGAIRINSPGWYRIQFGLSIEKFGIVQLYLNKVPTEAILDINTPNHLTSQTVVLPIAEAGSILHLMNIGDNTFSLNSKRHPQAVTAYLDIQRLSDWVLDPPPENN
jgi:hypothetical protein